MKIMKQTEELAQNPETETKQCSPKYPTLGRQILASISVTLASLGFGMAFAFTGTLLPLIRDYVNENGGTWLAATNVFFMIVGGYASTHVIPLLGNRICLLLTQILSIAGWLCLSLAHDFLRFDVGCMLVGFSGGFSFQITLRGRAEISEPRLRGPLCSIVGCFFMLGVLVGHLSALVFPWRTAMQCCALVPLLTAFTIFFYPEPPSWLLYRDRVDEARETFFWLRGVTADSEQEFQKMVERYEKHKKGENRVTAEEIFSRKFLVPLYVSVSLLAAQCGSGIDVIIVYAVDLIRKMSNEINAGQVTIMVDAVGLVFNVVACVVVQKMSRRLGFLVSSVGTILTLILLMSIVRYQLSALAFTLCLAAYTAMVNVGVAPLSWVVTAEIFPETNRDIGICVSTGFLNLFTFALVQIVPLIEFYAGIVAVLGFFCCLMSINVFSLYLFMPETKDVSLQDIEDLIVNGRLYRYASILRCTRKPK